MRLSPCLLPAVLALGTLLTLGCTRVIESTNLSQAGPVACQSELGAYYLPKALIRLKVDNPQSEVLRGFAIGTDYPYVQMTADRLQVFCLDYLSLPTSRDLLAVERMDNGLLLQVSSDVTDRSPEIAITLIKTAEQLAIAAGRFGLLEEAGPEETLDLLFDPFDPDELTRANTALRRTGMCLYVEGHSFLEPEVSPERWCSSPGKAAYMNPQDRVVATAPIPAEAMNSGILYRAPMAHKIVIMRKSDPSSKEGWKLYKTRRLEMPNVSPVFSIGVSRAMFANRKTTLTFDQGMLTNVDIDKGSELEGFVRIPLALAQAIVNVPAQILQLRINVAEDRTELANKQGLLINAIKDYRETLTGEPRSATTLAVDPRSGAFAGTARSSTLAGTARSGALAAGDRSGGLEARQGRMIGGCIDATRGDAEQCRNAVLRRAR